MQIDQTTADLVRDSAAKFRESVKNLSSYREMRNTLPGFDPTVLSKMKALGWFGALIDEEYGGIGLGFSDMAAIAEELGRGLLAETLIASGVFATRVVVHSNGAAFKKRVLPMLASGELLTACAWQEAPNTIDPQAIKTTAVKDGSGFQLNGAKRFIAGASTANAFLVSALSSDGEVDIYCVPKDAPGLAVETEWRADGSPAGRITLNNVAVAADNVVSVGGCGPEALRRALDETNVVLAAELVGNMSEALDLTLAYLRERVQFGKPIGKFQVLQHRAVEIFIQRELAAAVVAESALLLDSSSTNSIAQRAASRAKSRAGDAAIKAGRDAIQLHGAFGFTDDCAVGLYLKRAMVVCAWLGSPAKHRLRLADRLMLEGGETTDLDRTAPITLELRSRFDAIMRLPAQDRDWEGFEDEEFRAVAAEFFTVNLPTHLRYLPRRPLWSELKEWYQLLGRTGWLAPGWPRAHGGMGLRPSKLILFFEEMGRAGAPKHLEQGVNHLGPLLIAHGSPEQKQNYLPKILTGEHLWCQGYSEPSAGSDLASLRTKAELVGDEFVINGQKIWTTMAHQATHMFALVRTGTGEKKQEGISFLIIELEQPGITITPIRNIAGEKEFCQVFLDDARTSASNLVGEMNNGWRVSRALLGYERLTTGSPRYCQVALARLRKVAIAMDLMRDLRFVDRLNEISLDVEDLGSLYQKAAQGVKDGKVPGPEISILKILATETLQKLTEILVESAGELGATEGEQVWGDQTIDILAPFLDLRSVTISAGSSQVQRNVLAQRVLAL